MSIQVIYGAGPLGLAVARALLSGGHRVRIVSRRGTAALAAQPELETIAGDAFDRAFNQRVCAGAHTVYQCAATAYSVAAWRDQLAPLQRHIMHAAADSGARLIVGDNLYMYGATSGAMREDSPTAPCSEKGRIRQRLAAEILDAHDAGAVRAAIVRGSDFYGPNVLNSILGERVVLPALRGKRVSLIGNIDVPHSFTYIEDFGRAMALVGADDAVLGQVWHVPNAPAITQRQMAGLLSKEIGAPMKIGAMGKAMLQIGGLFIPAAREAVEMMYQFERPFVVDHGKFAARFGDIATPHAIGISRTVAWYRNAFGIRNPAHPRASAASA